MRTIQVKLYKFNELSEEQKQKAIENMYDININFDWWDFIFEDALEIGLKISSFDLDRNRHATGNLTEELPQVCKNILENHGDVTATYQLAKKWQHKHGEDNEEEFSKELLEEYSIMLQKECEYLTTEEAIIETIEANEYEFYEDGKLA